MGIDNQFLGPNTISPDLDSDDLPPAKRLRCAALATGMKCLPQDKIHTLHGNVIHDSHAEILALRAFNRFLLDQCADLAERRSTIDRNIIDTTETILEWRTSVEDHHSAHATNDSDHLWQGQPFRLRKGTKLHMYCSEAPCGDASMELTMAAQSDATPWARTPSPQLPHDTSESGLGLESAAESHMASPHPELYGRSYFDVLGVVRRKPARPDAPPTLSKSCSDKLALKQSTSILSSIASLLIHPDNAYIHTVILPSSQYVEKACQRAFGPEGRMAPLVKAWDRNLDSAGYRYTPFQIKPTNREFSFSRRAAENMEHITITPSNISSLTHGSNQETLINGVLQGRKQTDPKGASALSRRTLWSLALKIAASLGERAIIQALSRPTYYAVKSAGPLQARKLTKKLTRQGPLSGWKPNSGDDDWSL